MAGPLSVEEFEKMEEGIKSDPDTKYEVVRPSVEEIKAALSIQVDVDRGVTTEFKVTLWWHDELISEDNFYI